jgi:hypothetical protein
MGILVSILFIGSGVLWIFWRSWKGEDVDRRWIFLFIGLTVALALLFRIEFSEKATPIVKALYDQIENLPESSNVMISFDYDPAMRPEVGPMANNFVRHALAKKHKLYLMSLWATGKSLLNVCVDEILIPEFGDELTYGEDWVMLGYRTGNQGVINVIITDIRKLHPTDAHGNVLDSLPIFENVNTLKEMDLIISVGGGTPGIKEWVLFAGDRGDIPIGGGAAAVVAPLMYPYYPRQLVGLLGGTKGAAEYETLLTAGYERFADIDTPALKMMGPQTMAHVVIMAFILIGNISYFRSRRRENQ